MNRIFLGPVIHWVILAGLVALGWFAGANRFHVSLFNPFLILLLVLVVGIVLAILLTSPPGRRVTRDPIEEPDDEVG